MDLLRDNELIYGRLLPVEEPHLIERYNKALKAFGLKPTKLKTFEIDRTGFSPQIAEELGDPHYLDPNEVNRRFIILTPAQVDLPVVHTAFSNTSQLVYEFIDQEQPRHRRADDQGRDLRRDRGFGLEGRGHRGPACRSIRSSSACCRPRTCSARHPNSARWSTG